VLGPNIPAILLDELTDETVTETSLHTTSWMKRYFKDEHAKKKKKKKQDQPLNSVVMSHKLILLLSLFGSFLSTIFMAQKVSIDMGNFSISLTTLESVFQSFITPYLVRLVPYSGFLYVGVLVLAAMVRHAILSVANKKQSNCLPKEQPTIIVSPTLQKMHNLNMSFQSFLLIVLTLHACQWLSFNPYTIFLDDARYGYPNLHLLLGVFLLSKLCEWVDTVILILNGKPLLLLHLWHHGTIFWGFYHGFWCSAQSWIAFWNSLIHVVMYIYYAKLKWPNLRPLASWITTTQIIHLVGGTLLAGLSALGIRANSHPSNEIDPRLLVAMTGYSRNSSAFSICALVFSYVGLFLAFYGRRYVKVSGSRSKRGSLWALLGGKRLHTFVKNRIQDPFFGWARRAGRFNLIARWACTFECYLVEQGLLVDHDPAEEDAEMLVDNHESMPDKIQDSTDSSSDSSICSSSRMSDVANLE
jgi:hypothetical protein